MKEIKDMSPQEIIDGVKSGKIPSESYVTNADYLKVMSYFKPKFDSVHEEAIQEFKKDSKVIRTKSIKDIFSIFFKF